MVQLLIPIHLPRGSQYTALQTDTQYRQTVRPQYHANSRSYWCSSTIGWKAL